jgi:hypothetical protein
MTAKTRPADVDFSLGPYRFRFGCAPHQPDPFIRACLGLHLWMFNSYYWELIATDLADLAEAKERASKHIAAQPQP